MVLGDDKEDGTYDECTVDPGPLLDYTEYNSMFIL